MDEADEEASVFDDADFPLSGSGEVDDPMMIDADAVRPAALTECLNALDELRAAFSSMQVSEHPTEAPLGHRATVSLDAGAPVSVIYTSDPTLEHVARLIADLRLQNQLPVSAHPQYAFLFFALKVLIDELAHI